MEGNELPPTNGAATGAATSPVCLAWPWNEEARRMRRRRDHCSVWLVVSWRPEMGSGSNYKYSRSVKEIYGQEIHGGFFSVLAANRKAREVLREALIG